MARPIGSKNKPKVSYYCEECDESDFPTKKCPSCGNMNTLRTNQDGIPLTDIQEAISPQLPMTLGSTPDHLNSAEELRRVDEEEKIQTISALHLDKLKARAAIEKAERLRAEQELAMTEAGFKKPHAQEEYEDPMMPKLQRPGGMDSSMVLKAIGGWSDEAREDLFDRLSTDDDFALKWSRAFNTSGQPQMPMNAQQMMDQQMMQMMQMNQQQQAPAAPPESMASMMTGMIAAMAQLQELSGANKTDNGGMDKIMDRLERMDERHNEQTNAMQKEMMELRAAQSNAQVTKDDVQRMTEAAISNSASGGGNLMAGIEAITGVVSGLEELGIVRRPDEKSNNADDFERLKWKDEMAYKREERVRGDTKEERDAAIILAKNEATTQMFSMMLEMSKDATNDDDKPKDQPLPPAISRAVVS